MCIIKTSIRVFLSIICCVEIIERISINHPSATYSLAQITLLHSRTRMRAHPTSYLRQPIRNIWQYNLHWPFPTSVRIICTCLIYIHTYIHTVVAQKIIFNFKLVDFTSYILVKWLADSRWRFIRNAMQETVRARESY